MKNQFSNLLSSFKFLVLLLASSLLLWGCDATSPKNESDNSQILQDVQNFRSTYSSSLSHLGNYLDNHNASLRDEGAVKAGMQDFVRERSGPESDAYSNATDAFESHYQQASNLKTRTFGGGSNLSKDLPAEVREVAHKAQDALQNSGSYGGYKEQLREIQREVLDKDWNEKEKEKALVYLVIMEETTGFLNKNQHLVTQTSGAAATTNGQPVVNEEEEEGWWESWGKCAAGTIGGAGTGALAGAAAGTTIPEPMTTGAGAAIGGVSGALTGAAASC